MILTTEWVNEWIFPFPVHANELVHVFITSNTISPGRNTDRGQCQGLGRVLALLFLVAFCQSMSDTLV